MGDLPSKITRKPLRKQAHPAGFLLLERKQRILMKISAKSLREATASWPAPDKKDIEKRIGKNSQVNLLEVYKLFMPDHFRTALVADGMAELASKWENFRHEDQALENIPDRFFHEGYLKLEDKALKSVLKSYETTT